MKNLFTLLCASALTLSANAQNTTPLVLTQANARTNPVGIDTMYGTVISSVPVINDGQYYTWDLGLVTLGSYRYYSEFAAASGFANATHSNKAYIVNGPMTYETNLMIAIEASGVKTYGERLKRQAFSLFAQTNNTADSVIVEAQDVMYSTPQVQIAFPATIGTQWSSTSKSSTNLRIYFMPTVINQPAQRKSITTSTSEVIGWGSMRIKRLDGKPSGYKPVLEVKTTISTIDSLYINGAPAPAILLQQAGIQQGQTTVVYQKSFYRDYELFPMTNVTYTDATFSQRKDVNMHSQRLNYPDGVSDIPAIEMPEIYPNPSQGVFTVRLADAVNGKWSYAVTDITGKQVAVGKMEFNGQKEAQVDLTQVQAGVYFMNIEYNGQAIAGKKITIL